MAFMLRIAIDGGATKTVAAVYDGKKIISLGVSGPSNYRNIGIYRAIFNINRAIDYALKISNLNNSEINEYTFAIAGVKDSDKSTEIVNNIVKKISGNKNYNLFNDGEAGYFSRFLNNDGIVLAPGTGMISYGKYNNRVERSSGWGWLIGDEGGGFYIGKMALQKFAQIEDLRDIRDSELDVMIKQKFKIENGRDLVNLVYKDKITIREIAGLSVIVSELANKNDPIAKDIILNAAYEAAKCAISLNRKLKFENVTISGYGGVYRSGNLYWDNLKSNVLNEIDNAEFLNPIYGYHAVAGSILLSLAEANIPINENDRDDIISQIDKHINKLPEQIKQNYLYFK